MWCIPRKQIEAIKVGMWIRVKFGVGMPSEKFSWSLLLWSKGVEKVAGAARTWQLLCSHTQATDPRRHSSAGGEFVS